MKQILLIGNPNCGKTTLFNRITGLNQKTSNLPGTTVEAYKGKINIQGEDYQIIDLLHFDHSYLKHPNNQCLG